MITSSGNISVARIRRSRACLPRKGYFARPYPAKAESEMFMSVTHPVTIALLTK